MRAVSAARQSWIDGKAVTANDTLEYYPHIQAAIDFTN